MVSGRLLTDELILHELPVQHSHPMDSSRVLLGLMALSRKAAEPPSERDPLEGVISTGVLRSLLGALHFRDVATVRHSRRVAMLAVGMAQYLGWEGRHLKVLEVAALLHDIGKIGVPDNILFKPGALSPDEAELMSLHHNIGVDVLQACRADQQVLEIVGYLHSHYNGASEGFRRIGGEVPLGARILSVADAYDSLSTEQVYRKAKPHAEIMTILEENAGTQFDGNIVSALSRWTRDEGPPFSGQPHGEFGQTGGSSGPTHPEDALEASTLCHIFAYLYLLESLYDGFYLVDSDLRIVIWNRGAEKLLGYSSQQMLNHVWTSRTLSYSHRDGATCADHDCPMHQVVATGKPSSSIFQMKHGEGHWKEIELQTVPLIDQNQRLQGVAEIFRDVSRSGRKPQEYRELRMAASRDPLTSVANRGELETQMAMLVSEFSERNYEEAFSIIFLDVDHFKSINDKFGHTVGDAVLIEIARLMQHETYSGELVGRYGGEEFVVLCPSTDIAQASQRAERLRIAISKTRIPELKERELTASFGVAQAEPGDSVESLLRRADKALYMAKDGGRNQTRTLTNAELLAGPAQEAAKPQTINPFLYQGTFFAFIAADMVVYKLGGFVNDQQAKLQEVTPKRTVFRLGSAGLLPYWGSTDERRPVEVELNFGEAELNARTGGRSRNNRVEVTIRIRPLGWIKDSKVFQARSYRVYKDLRAYFAAESQ